MFLTLTFANSRLIKTLAAARRAERTMPVEYVFTSYLKMVQKLSTREVTFFHLMRSYERSCQAHLRGLKSLELRLLQEARGSKDDHHGPHVQSSAASSFVDTRIAEHSNRFLLALSALRDTVLPFQIQEDNCKYLQIRTPRYPNLWSKGCQSSSFVLHIQSESRSESSV